MHWYQKSAKSVCEELKVDPKIGLSQEQVKKRFSEYGANILAQKKSESILSIFLRQFKSPLVYVLVFASFIIGSLGQVVDALVIMAVIVLNSIVGAVQEGRARNSLEKLRSLTRHRALVRREGDEVLISSEEVVPGDILILNEGDKVIADARIIFSESLKVDESVLTGEVYAVEKSQESVKKDGVMVGDQIDMVFSGTSISSGHCEAVVVATGIESELGKISKELLETSDIPLPLAAKINRLTRFIIYSVSIICLLVFVVGVVRGISTLELFAAVVGLSVSIIPEGLPVAVTIVLAGGVWRMAKNKAIVRQMAAVEAMGMANVLMVDKTGTITTGDMKVTEILFNGKKFSVTGEGYNPDGKILGLNNKDGGLKKLLGLCLLSLKANVVHDEGDGWRSVGDQTEAAVAAVCFKAKIAKEELEQMYKTVYANPFNSEKRYIEACFLEGRKKFLVYLGAPDFIAKDLGVDHGLLKDTQKLTSEGRRVIALAVFEKDKPNNKFVGSILFAIDEEIRAEVEHSISAAHKAGFKVVMMTGDYPVTATAIAKKVGIFRSGDVLLTAEEVEVLPIEELAQKVKNATVFARITPTHKLKIVRAFQAAGYVCAMTGDGVNDGPALQAANLGIGLGSGTQVAKDASDIVLTDNNFSTIIEAISEGRAIYLTLKKVILYLFSTSLGEVLVIAGTIFIGLPLPVVAVQIIWLNFVTDGFFVVALAQDKTRTSMLSVSRDRNDQLVDRLMIVRMLIVGFCMLVAALPVFIEYYERDINLARTMVLVILSATQWFNAFNVRSRFKSVFTTPMNNVFLLGSFGLVMVLQFLIVQTQFGNEIMHTVPMSVNDWVFAFLISTIVVWAEEVRKYFARKSVDFEN